MDHQWKRKIEWERFDSLTIRKETHVVLLGDYMGKVTCIWGTSFPEFRFKGETSRIGPPQGGEVGNLRVVLRALEAKLIELGLPIEVWSEVDNARDGRISLYKALVRRARKRGIKIEVTIE